MLEPSRIIFGTSVLLGLGVLVALGVLLRLGVLVAVRVLRALGVLKRTGIALRCDPSSPGHSRPPTSCRSYSQGRNPSWIRIPSHTRSP